MAWAESERGSGRRPGRPPSGSRQRGDHAISVHPGHGAREHGARADLVPREAAKRLAEAVELLLEQPVDRLVRAIASRRCPCRRS